MLFKLSILLFKDVIFLPCSLIILLCVSIALLISTDCLTDRITTESPIYIFFIGYLIRLNPNKEIVKKIKVSNVFI